jgi:tetratricopeptide (TPR) repeat protein
MFPSTARFRPIDVLGKGGMGVVYRAFDAESGRVVALKTVRRPSGDDLYHLKEEFRALTGISHPNLVELHELFVDGDQSYFTMEVIEGTGILEHLWGDGTTASGPGISGDGIARLDAVLPQVVAGIAALHDEGRLHRDLKPSNVMVTWEGRAVVLDFGLALAWREVDLDPASSSYGTQRYMSPEQLLDAPLTPASDWFALGVLLFEALTGTLPYRGTIAEIVEQQRRGPPSAAERLPGLPHRLEALVRALLQPVASARPGVGEILQLIHATPSAPRSSMRMLVPVETPFLGRARELEALREGAAQVDAAGLSLVTVEGVSGVGKTELLRRFLATLEVDAGTVILRGRCQPRESVRFKAFDGLVDALSRHLRRLGDGAAAFRPADLRDLLRVFPVLARVAGFDLAHGDDGGSAHDPRAARRRAFAALRSVFARLGASARLVLWIDDAHWADEDSVALLRALFQAPDPPRALVIASWQRELGAASSMVTALEALGRSLPPGAHTALAVEALRRADARELARRILGEREVDLDALLTESGGTPYYLTELCRRARELPPGEAARLRLSDVIGERLRALPPAERTLLEFVALAGRPLPRALLVPAAGVGGLARRALLRLGELRLARSTSLPDDEVVEPWHDRVRAAVVEATAPERRQEVHRRLAEAMMAVAGADPEALVLHLEGAGDPVRAASFAIAAAGQAEQAMAFDRAAALYTVALAHPPPGVSLSELWRLRADALVGGGRGAEAAEAFVRAADSASGATAGDVLDLRRRAAEQFLFSGRYEEGLRVMRSVLDAVGVALPSSPRAAILAALAGRTRFLARSLGPGFLRRGAAPVSPQRLDALWTACAALSMVQPALADAMGVQHLLESLDLGDPSRAVRALGYEATCESSLGGAFFRGRSRRLLDETARLAASTGRPYDLAWSRMAEGTAAWLQADWASAFDRCDAALALYTRECRGVAWETATSRIYSLSALALMGRFAELGRRMPEALNEAEAHGDRFALGGYCVGQQGLHWVAAGRLDAWRAFAERARSTWLPGSFHLQRYSYLVAATQADLARGDGWAAFERIESEWAALDAAQLLRLEVPGIELLQLRARAALACAGRGAPSSRGAWTRPRLLALAADAAGRIARCPLPFAAPTAALLRGGHALRAGRPDLARRELGEAREGFARVGMTAHRMLVGWELDALDRATPAAAPEEVRAWAEREGVGDVGALRRALLWA